MWCGQGLKWTGTYSAHYFHNKQFWRLVVVVVCGCVCFGQNSCLEQSLPEPYSSTTCPDNSQTQQEPRSFFFLYNTMKTNLLQQPTTIEWCPSPLICLLCRPDSKGRMPPTESSTPSQPVLQSAATLNAVGSKSPPSDYSLALKNFATIWADRKFCSRRSSW